MIIFLSCVKKKKAYATIAEELYDSNFFHLQLLYAKSLNPKHIYILSAKYGVLELTDKISPYEKTLNNMSAQECLEWSNMVIRQLKDKNFDFNEETIFLCGEKYRKYLTSFFTNYKIPLMGLGIGKQLQWFKNNTRQTN